MLNIFGEKKKRLNNFIIFLLLRTMDTDVQEQLISTIMKTFAYTKTQADYLFIQLMNCVVNRDLVSKRQAKQITGLSFCSKI